MDTMPQKRHRWTKEETIKAIYKLSSELNRPLVYTDFDALTNVSMGAVRKHFGTLNNMKKELGLELVRDGQDKTFYNPEEFSLWCDSFVYTMTSDQLASISARRIDNDKFLPSMFTLDKYSKEFFGSTFLTYLASHYGLNINNQGLGDIHKFPDGEIALSTHELNFSIFLKEQGFLYNKTYFKDVPYSEINPDYKGTMTCDYKIYTNNGCFYVELAGMLNCPSYEKAYLNQQPIPNPIQEDYRLRLTQKEQILSQLNVSYRIILPSNMNYEYYIAILQ